MKYKHTVHVNS